MLFIMFVNVSSYLLVFNIHMPLFAITWLKGVFRVR